METTLRLTMKNDDFLTGGYTRMELELEEFGYPDPYVEIIVRDGKIYKVVDLNTVQINEEYQPRTLLPACMLVIDIPPRVTALIETFKLVPSIIAWIKPHNRFWTITLMPTPPNAEGIYQLL
ncbi:MAG: hypothetical protein QW570_07795 [Candidatus Caldarchaeum sp.]